MVPRLYAPCMPLAASNSHTMQASWHCLLFYELPQAVTGHKRSDSHEAAIFLHLGELHCWHLLDEGKSWPSALSTGEPVVSRCWCETK